MWRKLFVCIDCGKGPPRPLDLCYSGQHDGRQHLAPCTRSIEHCSNANELVPVEHRLAVDHILVDWPMYLRPGYRRVIAVRVPIVAPDYFPLPPAFVTRRCCLPHGCACPMILQLSSVSSSYDFSLLTQDGSSLPRFAIYTSFLASETPRFGSASRRHRPFVHKVYDCLRKRYMGAGSSL